MQSTGCPPCNIGEDSVIVDNDIYESVVLHNKSANNLRTHFSDEHLVVMDGYAKPTGRNALKTSPPKCQKPVTGEWEHSPYSSNFVQNVTFSLVGTAKRVKKKKSRERSKSKESKRRDSSESRLASLADFFRSPSGSRKSSLNSPRSTERKNSVTIKINDTDGLESSPENSVGKKSQHKSRMSKSPLRVFNKMKAWGSRDALDDKAAAVKVEYSVLDNTISIPRFSRRDSDQNSTMPKFLTANSREGIDFESLESELCNFDSEHSNDSSISKNSVGFFHESKSKKSSTSFDSITGVSDACSNQRPPQLDHSFSLNSSLNQKSKSNEYLRSCEEDHTDSANSSMHAPSYIQDCDYQNSSINYGPKRSPVGSVRDVPSHSSSEDLNAIDYTSPKPAIPEKFLKKSDN